MLVTCIGSGELMLFDANQQELLRETRMHGDRSEQSSRPLDVVSGKSFDSRNIGLTDSDSEFSFLTVACDALSLSFLLVALLLLLS